ncbi:MAG: transporter [Patescibacteria group bacterium]|jgi:MFS family permease|nr:transporter [Patescibacteria group bacterium]
MYSKLLRNPEFLKIWVAQITSQLATNLLNFALIIRVYELAANTRYANIAVSLLILAFGVPSIIFAVLAGAYVDHWDRKKVLIVTNIVRAVLVLGFLIFSSNLLMIYLIVFAVSVFSQFFTPAEGAALPKLVKKSELVSANSLFLFTLYGSFVVGYSLAGPIISLWGPDSVYWVTSISFVVASVLCISLPNLRAKLEYRDLRQVNKEVFSTIHHNFVRIIKNPSLILPIANLTIAQAMLGVIAVLAPAIAILVFNQSLAAVSYKIVVPAALGMVVGAILVGTIFKSTSKTKLINIGISIASLMLIGLSFVPKLNGLMYFGVIVAGIALVLGVSNGLVSVSAQTLLQLNSTDETRGKIFGTLNMMMNIAAIVPVFLAGVTADLISPLSVLTISGVLIGLYGIFQYRIFNRLQLKST